MSTRRLIVIPAFLLAVARPDLVAAFGAGGSSNPDGSVTADAEQSTAETVADGSAGAGPVCSWTESASDALRISDGMPIATEVGRPLYRNVHTQQPVRVRGPNIEVLYRVGCPDSTRWAYYLPREYIDVGAVIADARAHVERSVPVPVPDIWPAAEVAAVPVQYGMWFAVADPGQVNAFAQAGPVWASVTARFRGFTVDMGTAGGDVVECAGAGEPYPHNLDPTDYSEGPCGFTYRYQSDLGVRTITMTGHWEVHLVTSEGDDRVLDPIDRATSFDYEVYEIRTVIES